jgi:hypothetical protein
MSLESFAVKHVIKISKSYIKSKKSSIDLKSSISANMKAALYVKVKRDTNITSVFEKPHTRPTFDSG